MSRVSALLLILLTILVQSLTTMGLNIAVERPPSPYDLLWPLARRKAGPVKSTVSEDQSLVPLKPFGALDSGAQSLGALYASPDLCRPPPSGPGSVKRPTPRGNALQFEEYANRLLILSHREERQHQPHLDAEEDSRSIANTVREHGERTAGPLMSPLANLGDLEEEMGGALTGCRENVEILTRVSRKSAWFVQFVSFYPTDECSFSVVRYQQGWSQGCCADLRQDRISTGRNCHGCDRVQRSTDAGSCLEGE